MKRKTMPTGSKPTPARQQGKPPGNSGVNKPVKDERPKSMVGTKRMVPTAHQKM